MPPAEGAAVILGQMVRGARSGDVTFAGVAPNTHFDADEAN